MAHDKEISLTPGTWGPDAERWISQALQTATPDDIKYQVEHQGARLFYVQHQGSIKGAFVLRVDQHQDRAEGVIVAGAGNVPGVDLMAVCIPAIESIFVNCQSVRYHTAKPAVARKMHRLGYIAAEIVSIKRIAP
jgi:hypothetical protein